MNPDKQTTPEYEHEPRILDFFNLNEEDVSKLQERIKQSDGLVRIFIHPLDNVENSSRVREILVATLFSEKAPPIIIFEYEKAKEIWTRVFENGEHKMPNDAYMIPTIANYPYPKLEDRPEPERDSKGWLKDESLAYVEEGIEKFISELEKLGAKKLLVGGTSLEIRKNTLTRCVGNFIGFMKMHSDFELKVSSGTAPLNREDMRENYPDLV